MKFFTIPCQIFLFDIDKKIYLDSVHIKSKTKVKARNMGCGRNKNRIKGIITSKNVFKMFQSQKILFDIIALFIKVSIITPYDFFLGATIVRNQ